MSGHTKGPWKWWTSCSWRRLKRDGLDSENVAYPYVAKDGQPDISISEADMALIAAAPEMLEALRAYQKANRIHNDAEDALFAQAEAAIAKAEGRP